MVGVLGALGAGAAGGAGINIVISAIDNFSGIFTRASLSMANFRKAGLAAAVVGGLMAAGMVSATKAAAKVETGYAKVNTLLDKGQDAQELFADFVAETNIQMGNQGDQLDVLSGLYQTISAGITDTAESQKFMAAATKAAVGGSAELSTVILAGTKAIAAFGLDIDDTTMVMDAFAGTVKAGQTTMGELANAFPTVAGMAGQAGITIEETLGTFAGLTKVLSSSEETATSLSATIRGFIKPTTDMQKAVKELGFESSTTMIKELGLNEALKQLNEYVDADTEAMAKLFPNVRALKAVFPLLGLAAEDVASSIDIVSNSTGLSQKQFEDMTDTLDYKWGVAVSNSQNLMIQIGNIIKTAVLPVLEKLTAWISKVVDWWNTLHPATQKMIIIFTAITAAVLILAGAIALITLIASPWLAIVIAIGIAVAALTAGMWYLYNRFKIVRDIVSILWSFLKLSFLPIIIAVKIAIWHLTTGWGLLKAAFSKIIGPIKTVISWLKTLISIAKSALDWIAKVTGAKKKESSIRVIPKTTTAGVTTTAPEVIRLGGKTSDVIRLGDFILSKGKVYQTHPQDTIIGTKGGVGTAIYINNLNGFNARDIADKLQDELTKKITIG